MNTNKKTACGAIFISAKTGRVLLNLRSPTKSHGLTWGLWGGMVEKNETPFSGLIREFSEEIGFVPEIEKINPFDVFNSDDGHFTYYSFIVIVDDEFIPKINGEAVGYCWTKLGVWPTPMHEGAKETLCNDHSINKMEKILKIFKDCHEKRD